MPRNSPPSSASKPFSYRAAVFQTPRAPVALPRATGTAAAPALPPYRPPAGPAAAPPSVNHHMQVEQPTLFSSMKHGFGLGIGQSLAFNWFRSPEKVVVEHKPVATGTAATVAERIPRSREYTQCMEESKQDEEACKHLLNS